MNYNPALSTLLFLSPCLPLFWGLSISYFFMEHRHSPFKSVALNNFSDSKGQGLAKVMHQSEAGILGTFLNISVTDPICHSTPSPRETEEHAC